MRGKPTDELARYLLVRTPERLRLTGATTAGGNSLETEIRLLPLPIGAVGAALVVALNAAGDAIPAWGAASRLVTASGSVTAADRTIGADATDGVVTLSLPAASAGAPLVVKKVDATATHVVLAAASGETIDGAASYTLTHSLDAVAIVPTTGGWWVVGFYAA